MNPPIVIIGIGEMAGVFARGFLRCGHPVYPVTRQMDPDALAAELPEPLMVLVAVAEKDLQSALRELPRAWRPRVMLLQNELLPADWEAHGLEPTVISVWFEKKKGQDHKVLVPSPVHGPHAALVARGLATLDIPTAILADRDQLLFELVRKNLYIVTTNVAGLKVGGTVQELREHHAPLMHEVADDVLAIQEHLTGVSLPRARLMEAMLAAFDGDPHHRCMGRSAPARLARAIVQAGEAGIEVPALGRIAAETTH